VNKVTLRALHVQIKNVLKHDHNRVEHYRFWNAITLRTCYRCCEWRQWCQSHVIHCRCNICCKL